MTLEGHRALAYILVGKALPKTRRPVQEEAYNASLRAPDIRRRASTTKKARGRKIVTSSRTANLRPGRDFDDTNKKYFGNSIERPLLTWSSRKTYRILGHHDATHKKIVISRSLDTPETPRYIVEYVIFHEMLHIAHPTKHVNGRRYNHTPAFRRDERKFPHYRAAENWIEKNVNRLRRAAKRK